MTPVVLAITWLPYIATRCIENPLTHVGCGMLPAAHAHASAAQEHADKGAAPERHAHHHHEHNHGPAHTCCDLTGKCNVKVSSGPPSLTPIQMVATLPVTACAIGVAAPLVDTRTASTFAHGPPTYLRNLTLRI